MSEVFRTVLSMSIGASVLGIMVLAARAIIGSRQTAALTLMLALLVARLVVPVNIESRASVMNLLPDRMPQAQTEVQINYSGAEDIGYVPAQVQQETASLTLENDNTEASEVNTVLPVDDTSAESQSVLAAGEETQPQSIDFWTLAAYIWAAGMAALALVIFISNAVFMRKVRRNREYDLPGLEGLISQCAEEFGIKKKIRAVRMSEINNVAVCGIIKPKLLISPDTFEKLSTQQKKDVIMHEMSHIKRRDTLVSLVMTIVNIVHWFNPVVWAAFALFRKDMEVMCDSKVLCRMEAWQRKSYADTLLTLAKNANSKRPKLAMALFMSKASIKRRITMVARYKKNKPVITALALILVVGIAVTGCTGRIKNTTNSTDVNKPITVEEGLSLIGSSTLNYSRYVEDGDRVYNMKKAASMLDGLAIPPGEQIRFVETIGPIDEENGWKIAPGFMFKSVMQMIEASHWEDSSVINTDLQVEQIGGGIGLIEMLFFKAAGEAQLDRGAGGDFEGLITAADSDLKNLFNTEVVFEVIEEDNTIVVNIYGPNDYKEQKQTILTKSDQNEITENGADALDENNWSNKFADKFTDGEVSQTEDSYKSANVSVEMTKYESDGVVYFVADIYLTDIKYFKTAFGENKTSGREFVDDNLANNNGIVGINGDNCWNNPSLLIRNGVYYDLYSSSNADQLVMYVDGSMETISGSDFDFDEIKEKAPYQVWGFGPMLLDSGGQPMSEFNSTVAGRANPHTAVGYFEPGHYCFVVVDGRRPDDYSAGMTRAELSQLMYDLGCKVAFNLDGGDTSQMAFMDSYYNIPSGSRKADDMIYITDSGE